MDHHSEQVSTLSSALVQILDADGTVVGTGFFCHPKGYILTCWHVVQLWPKSESYVGRVRHRGRLIPATIERRCSFEDADIAVLAIQPDGGLSTTNKQPFLEIDTDTRTSPDDKLTSIGYPTGQFSSSGIPVSANLTGSEEILLQGSLVLPIHGLNLDNIDHGYSGAPVLNEAIQKVVGLVRAKHHSTQAFIVPIEKAFVNWPELRDYHNPSTRIRRSLALGVIPDLQADLGRSSFVPRRLELRSEGDGGPPERPQHRNSAETSDRFREDFPTDRFFAPLKKQERERRVANRNLHHYLLSSDVGTGKTTYLRWLAQQIADNTQFVPILLSCEQFAAVAATTQQEFLATYAGQIQGHPYRDLIDFLQKSARQRRLFFLLDGLDQIGSQRPSVFTRRAQQIASGSRLLISTRPSAALGITDNSQFSTLRLAPFNLNEQGQFFGSLFAAAQKMTLVDLEMLSVPMLAYMVRDLLRTHEYSETPSRTDLYSWFLRHVLRGHQPNRSLFAELPDLARDVADELRRLAFDSLNSPSPAIQRVPVDFFPSNSKISISDMAEFGLVNRIMDRGEDAFFFTHQSFQEFLAAQFVSGSGRSLDLLLDERWNPKWTEVIRFLVGLRGEIVIEKILTGPDNTILSNLFLASEFVRELDSGSTQLIVAIKQRLFELTEGIKFRRHAIHALRNFSQYLTDDDLERLIRLAVRDSADRESVIEILDQVDVRSETLAIDTISAILGKDDSFAQVDALKVLIRLPDRVRHTLFSDVLTLLGGAENHVRDAAMELIHFDIDLIGLTEIEYLHELASRDGYLEIRDLGGLRCRVLRILSDERIELSEARSHLIFYLLTNHRGDREVIEGALIALRSVSHTLNDAELRDCVKQGLQHDHHDVGKVASRLLTGCEGKMSGETLHDVVAALKSESSESRLFSVSCLSQERAKLDDEAVEKLINMLTPNIGYIGTSRETQEAVARTLGAISDTLKDSDVERVYTKLSQMDDERKNSLGRIFYREFLAAQSSRSIDDDVAEICGVLDGDCDSDVAIWFLETIASIGRKVNERLFLSVAKRLADVDNEVCASALKTLKAIAGSINDTLLVRIQSLLESSDATLRRAASVVSINTYERIDSAKSLVILDSISLEDEIVGLEMLELILGSESTDGGVKSALALFLVRHESSRVRQEAIRLLRFSRNEVSNSVVNEAFRIGFNSEASVKSAAIDLISHSGSILDESSKSKIWEAIRDSDVSVRLASLRALRKFVDPDSFEELADLLFLVNDESKAVREALLSTCAEYSPEVLFGSAEVIAAMVNDPRNGYSIRAIECLLQLGSRGTPEIIREVLEYVENESNFVNETPFDVLVNLRGFLSEEDFKRITTIAIGRKGSTSSQKSALLALGQLGRQLDKEVTEEIIRILQHSDEDKRDAAARALEGLKDSISRSMLPQLISAFFESNGYITMKHSEVYSRVTEYSSDSHLMQLDTVWLDWLRSKAPDQAFRLFGPLVEKFDDDSLQILVAHFEKGMTSASAKAALEALYFNGHMLPLQEVVNTDL